MAMQSIPRASVDINQEALAAQKSNSYTLTVNKKVVYTLGALLALVALATIGVASVSQHWGDDLDYPFKIPGDMAAFGETLGDPTFDFDGPGSPSDPVGEWISRGTSDQIFRTDCIPTC
jgi:hypothetical protein